MGVIHVLQVSLRVIDRIERFVLTVVFSLMVAVIVLQVISRSGFNINIPWAQDLAILCFVWVTFIGASVGAKMGSMIKIDSFLFFVPRRFQPFMQIFCDVCITIFLLFLTGWSYESVKNSWNTIIQSGLGWSSSVFSFSLLVEAPILALYYLLAVVKDLEAIKKGTDLVENGSEELQAYL